MYASDPRRPLRAPRRVASDAQMVVVCTAVATGAFVAHPVPVAVLLLGALGAVAGVVERRPVVLTAAAALIASALAAHAWSGLVAPPAASVRSQWVTLLTDPAPFRGGTIGAEARFGHRHVQVWARGPSAGTMAVHLAGESLRVSGMLRPLSVQARRRAAPRHIAARLTVSHIDGARRAGHAAAMANAYRRVVSRGAAVLPESLRPLFGGMVLGDDRGQAEELTEAFRAAGLTHLLVVSGQNVAFALLVAAPLIRRGGLRWRFVITLLVLAGFGVLTRWEPSVLRAEAMAAVAAAGALVGRPVPGLRLIAVAVTGCVLVDPLLVHSVGFQLSVAACSGLIVLTPALQRRRLPMLLAASVAAQLGAAVVLVPTFGALPIVSLPANVLAVPVAGPIMMWGLTAGPVAGLSPYAAGLLHTPTRLALRWEAGVATRAARLPVAPLGPRACIGLAVVVLGAFVTTRASAPAAQRRGAKVLGALIAIVVVGYAMRGPASARDVALMPGARLWVTRGASLVALQGARPAAVLRALRERRIHRLDVLVVTQPSPGAADDAWPVMRALRPRLTVAPPQHHVPGAHTVRAGTVIAVGTLYLRVEDEGPPMRLAVATGLYRPRRATASRGPPRGPHP